MEFSIRFIISQNLMLEINSHVMFNTEFLNQSITERKKMKKLKIS